MTFLQEVKAEVARWSEISRRDAKSQAPYVKSRGRFLSANHGELLNAAECWDWDGTLKGLQSALLRLQEMAAHKGVVLIEISIEGGHDGSDCAQWLFDDSYDYEPWLGSWYVEVWNNADGWKVKKSGVAA